MSCKINPCSFISLYLDQYQIKIFLKNEDAWSLYLVQWAMCKGLERCSSILVSHTTATKRKCKACLCLLSILTRNSWFQLSVLCVCLKELLTQPCFIYQASQSSSFILLEKHFSNTNPNFLNHSDRQLPSSPLLGQRNKEKVPIARDKTPTLGRRYKWTRNSLLRLSIKHPPYCVISFTPSICSHI